MDAQRSDGPVRTAIRARHARMMAASGATGNPEDYRAGLTYLLPFAGPPCLLVFCGCCQAPLQVLPAIGLWVGWQRSGALAPLCAICLEVLRRGAPPGAPPVHVLPEYDPLGQSVRHLFANGPTELAQLRLALVEVKLPAGLDAEALAREVHAEAIPTLAALAREWERQRPSRLKLGREILALQHLGTAEAAEEVAGIVHDVPGALQAADAAVREGGQVA